MDFLKTLLVYLSLTYATSVQGAPTPAPTEIPTATPVAVVETEASTPSVDLFTPATTDGTYTPVPAPTDTPAPTLTPAPAPTMTPNAEYKTLQQGDRGDRVKELQQRLKELGYLEGEVDGAYGAQTRRAVQRFQYYNGLSQDGIAGKNTLTVLYESESIVAAVTATPEPSATPTAAPSEMATVEATVNPPQEATATPNPTLVPPLSQPEATSQVEAGLTTLTLREDSNMVVNGSGEPLYAIVPEDGVTVEEMLRVYTDGAGEPLVDAAFLAQCLESWSWTPDAEKENAYTLDADGFQLVFTLEADESGDIAQAELTVDGKAVELEEGDVRRLADGTILIRAAVLEKAIGATYVWDAEENALVLHYVSKELADAQD